MKIFRLIYLAVILLVLLYVGSAMGGSGDIVLAAASENESGVCLSFKHRKNLTACCNHADKMQIIRVYKTSPNQGIFHSFDQKRILCYEKNKKRFRILKTNELLCHKVRHNRRNRVDLRNVLDARHRCKYSLADIKNETMTVKGRKYQCMLYEDQSIGFTYISAEKEDKFLAVRNGRVQKVSKKIRDKHKKLLRIPATNVERIVNSSRNCAR
ncbi:uncharacterized protein LOC125046159 [Penaeus chinensis]|uniref:uncharacterized protein LOC125046159 n=1 Tax=Penaeus chinensis TaxID=139456 RepID=UPI001FB7C330|nr:uncharacterized protein LOC125046159 [Penaeus chinensis]